MSTLVVFLGIILEYCVFVCMYLQERHNVCAFDSFLVLTLNPDPFRDCFNVTFSSCFSVLLELEVVLTAHLKTVFKRYFNHVVLFFCVHESNYSSFLCFDIFYYFVFCLDALPSSIITFTSNPHLNYVEQHTKWIRLLLQVQ